MKWNYKTFETLVQDLEELPGEYRNDLTELFARQNEASQTYSSVLDQIRDLNLANRETSPGVSPPLQDEIRAIWHPLTFLGLIVDTAGFDYNPGQDIIKSTMYNFQRLLGYCRFYDDTSFLISSRLDCEVITFDYKPSGDVTYEWMIELWKGQYGIETGSEIGVYRRPKDKPLSELEKKVTGPLYMCVPDKARLDISFELNNHKTNDNFPLKRKGVHWWLTGFHWGVFCEPDDLQMNSHIIFPDGNMKEAFIAALETLGYPPNAITVKDTKVSFLFDKPYTTQPQSQKDLGPAIQIINKVIVKMYNRVKKKLGIECNDPNVIWSALTQTADPALRELIKKIREFFNQHYTNRLAIR